MPADERAVAVAVTGRVRREARHVDLAENATCRSRRCVASMPESTTAIVARIGALPEPVDRSTGRPRPQLRVETSAADSPIIFTVSFGMIDVTPDRFFAMRRICLPVSVERAPSIELNSCLTSHRSHVLVARTALVLRGSSG